MVNFLNSSSLLFKLFIILVLYAFLLLNIIGRLEPRIAYKKVLPILQAVIGVLMAGFSITYLITSLESMLAVTLVSIAAYIITLIVSEE